MGSGAGQRAPLSLSLTTQQLESQVLLRARGSAKVPPSLVVISRVRQFRIRRDGAGGFGLTVRGDCPVFVRSVDVPSPARAAGLRSGDLLLEVGGRSVRQASKSEVLGLLRASGDELALTVVTGGLDWSISAPPPLSSAPSSSSLLSQSRLARNKGRLQRATIFHNKVWLNQLLVWVRKWRISEVIICR